MKITKEVIEQIKDEIITFANRNKLGKDFSIFCNNKMFGYKLVEAKKGSYRYYYRKMEKDNVNPLDYCEYYPEEFILGLAYDGTMYEMINGYLGEGIYDKFTKIFEFYGLYLEHCDSCHATVCNSNNKDDDIEYTYLNKEEIKNIYRSENAPDLAIKTIMDNWYEMSKQYGDVGGCVIGAYMEFDYREQKYRMSPQSPWQGSCSWESHVDDVKKLLESIGATNVYFNYGRLD